MNTENQDSKQETLSGQGGVRERLSLLFDCYRKLFKVIFICLYLTFILIVITVVYPFIRFKRLEKLTDIVWDNTPVDF
jgi:hypothetical protein